MTDTDSPPTVPIVCPECGSRTKVPVEEVAKAVTRHNENLHGGEPVAEVDPDLRAELADLVAEDLDLM